MKLKEMIDLMAHYLKKLFGDNLTEKILAGGVVSFFFGNKVFAFFVLILIIVDFITGVVKSKKLRIKIESAKFMNTILKLYVYYSLILTLNIVAQISGVEIILRVGYTFIAITEAKSIIENLIAINPEIAKIKDEVLSFFKSNNNQK